MALSATAVGVFEAATFAATALLVVSLFRANAAPPARDVAGRSMHDLTWNLIPLVLVVALWASATFRAG